MTSILIQVRCRLIGASSLVIAGVLIASWGESAFAQLVPDTTLGSENSTFTPLTPAIDQIDGGATRGTNLFHSFQEFNVGEGRGVYFVNPTGIENILTRVTGSNASNIFGRLGVLGGANLFLLNPNGIVFGPNASLDIQGSFVATTAERIQLGDSSYFSAAQPQTSSLLSVSPGALFFNAVANQPGSIINQGNLATGKNLTLAAGNLDLQGQLLSGGDLTLQAQDTVKVRDSAAIPFIASAGGNLLVQGNQGIDIAALSHPYSGLLAGGNLVLRSEQTVVGDAHFWSGGNFSIERLDGSLGNLYSPHDPIILANGDVNLGDYGGASLHILAGGSVTLGSITIRGTGDATTTINPTNTNLFNGSRTYADLATVYLTDYKATLNSDGSVRSVDPVLVPLTIDGSTQATLDVRAGVDWAALGGLPTNRLLPGTLPVFLAPPPVSQIATSANITVNGNILVTQPAGLVLLTNQFSPNTLPGTISIRGNVNTSTSNTGANGGDIRVYGRGDIAVGRIGSSLSLDSYSYFFSDSGNAGNGGVISFATNSGNISLDNSISQSYSISASGNAGNGGVISFATNSGDISLDNSISYSDSYFFSDLGNAGNGGVISFFTNSGNISLNNSISSSFSYSQSYSDSYLGNPGNGGVISFATNSGNISLDNSYSSSISDSRAKEGNAGNGGVISFATNSGNISLDNSESQSFSRSEEGNAGNGGVISFATNSGNISLDNSESSSFSYSISGNAGNGGTIHLSARRGTISGSNSVLNSFAVSELGGSGNGGKVTLEAGSGVSGLTINTIASGGNSGDVEINGFGDLVINQTNILTAQQVEVKECQTCPSITIPLNDRGQAGNVAVTSTGSLTFSNSMLQSDTRGGNPAGSITITSPGIVSLNNSQIISNTSSTGQAGSITFKAPEIQLDSSSRLSAQTSSSGSAGNLTLQPYDGGQTLSILFQEGAQISASTSNLGTGGNLTIKAPNAITIEGQGTITTSTTGTGNAGNITLDTSTLTVARGAQLFALTEGSGNSGKIEVNASTAVNLGIGVDDFSPVLSVETSDAGQAGNIIINTPSLTLSDTARITATATSTATNTEGGGSITLNASTMDLAGVVGVFAETQGQTPAGTLTLKPYQNQSTLNLTLAPQSQVSASTTGSGKGGNLIVQAPEAITIQGSGQLAVQTTGDGAAGELRIDTQRLTIADGAQISASTSSRGNGGQLTITAPESITLTGNGSVIAAETGGSGTGGNLNLQTGTLNIQNQAQVTVSSEGTGSAGSLFVEANQIYLDNGGRIRADTSGGGGNINLRSPLIVLRNGSSITTNATGSNIPGGNINIDTDNLVAVPNEDSNITANSEDFRGGNVTVRASGIFGIEFREQPTRLSDITATGASSEFSGTVNLITPGIDPSRGLAELPTEVVDASDAIAQGCQDVQGSSFVVTGRGGLPPTPQQALGDDPRWRDWRTPAGVSRQPNTPANGTLLPSANPASTKSALVEATGWVFGADGQVMLTASAANVTSPNRWGQPVNCDGS
ncbi:filamentous hemagglutinin N-terminal domain-containing protein [Cyanobacteria bacterium FACHB-472]|nr:filamentous hemagglutinin N-terminal domain-containing protein [Cyanobacteria bacterium FACHB-472]